MILHQATASNFIIKRSIVAKKRQNKAMVVRIEMSVLISWLQVYIYIEIFFYFLINQAIEFAVPH